MKFSDIPKLSMNENGNEDFQISVALWQISPSLTPSLHWHDYCTIDVITEGNAIHYTPLKQQDIIKGYMHLVMPSDIHFIGSLEGCSIISIRFSPTLISDNLKELLNSPSKSTQLNESNFKAVTGIITAMSEYQNDKILVQHLLESLLLILQNNVSKNENELSDSMKKVTNYLDLHFRENPSLNKAAAVGSYNPSYFSSLFKKTTGYSYTEYLNVKKLNYACAIMNQKDLTLTDIALSAGFVSATAFNHTFKAFMGITPKEYRKKQK